MTKDYIQLHPNDDVIIAVREISAPTMIVVGEDKIQITSTIPAAHKIASRDIQEGEPIHRYNQIIGWAKSLIKAGDHVHSHNLGMINGGVNRAMGTHQNNVKPLNKNPMAEHDQQYFLGYKRPDGQIGTRNYIAIISSVNCSATVTRAISNYFSQDKLANYPNIDAVIPLPHPMGCGTGASGEAIEVLQRTVAGFARHPNFAGVLLVGLGCEQNQISPLITQIGPRETDMLAQMVIQDEGGTSNAIKKGIALVEKMLIKANAYEREKVSVSKLIVGLKCGGSDGYSGITANPALGGAADLLTALGATVVLSETPEIYGAEHLLINRAKNNEIATKLMARLEWWKAHTSKLGCEMDNNPSVGNKAGGLTTILEKSLGAVSKAGHSPLNEVYLYAEPIKTTGLVFMDTPGYDPVSVTGQAAGGAQIICFTTGRGSAFGCPGVPTIKLATNTDLYNRMRDDMDINCGDLIEGTPMTEISERIFQGIIDYASGKKVRSEILGYGSDEFIPWKIDATM